MPYSESQQECCKHEEYIVLLQEKLRETHTRLLEQLDISKEKELQIIHLRRQMDQMESSRWLQHNDQSFGAQNEQDSKENYQQMNINQRTVQRVNQELSKVDLLQADLEAMRTKLLSQVTQSNRLKEEIKSIKVAHKHELAARQRQFDQFQRKSSNQENLQMARIRNKYQQLQQEMETKKQECSQLLQQKANLSTKWQDQRLKVKRLQEQIHMKSSRESGQSQELQREVETLKQQIDRLNRNVEQSEMKYTQDRLKKKGYEETRELIKKLEEAENSMRKNKLK